MITRRLLRERVASQEAFMRFVDPQRGVLEVEYSENHDDTPKPHQNRDGRVAFASRLCGAKLDKAMARARKILALLAACEAADSSVDAPLCRNTPNIECVRLGDHDELTLYLRFVRDEQRGLVVDELLTLQEASVGERWHTRKDAFVKADRARFAATRCTH